MNTRTGIVFLATCLLGGMLAYAETPPQLQLRDVQRIWNKAPHNAFTDLLFHEGRWYCVFREGSAHVSPDGALRVLTSTDGEHWESLALVTHPTQDLRDAKLCVTPQGELMLNGAGMRAQDDIRYHSFVWFSKDQGKTWSAPVQIGDPGYWLWRAQWNDGHCYSMGYSTDRDRSKRDVKLYRSEDGRHYETLIPKLNLPNGCGEDTILFRPDGSAICLFRHETGNRNGMLGTSQPPYDHWEWREVNARIGGPNMIELPDGHILAATRLYDGRQRTALSWLDIKNGRLTEALTLPSGGDTSYPGLVWKDNELWISYYSSHEDRSSIYLARVTLSERQLENP